jgi:hypothetical protein
MSSRSPFRPLQARRRLSMAPSPNITGISRTTDLTALDEKRQHEERRAEQRRAYEELPLRVCSAKHDVAQVDSPVAHRQGIRHGANPREQQVRGEEEAPKKTDDSRTSMESCTAWASVAATIDSAKPSPRPAKMTSPSESQ